MIITRSTASTPICSPQLPPEIVMNTGALQPCAVRQVATPLPPLPPKIKPPLTMCGTTATHFACCNTSSGIPLSGIPIISCNTLVALSSRSVASSRADSAQHSVPTLNIASKKITFFMGQPHFYYLMRRLSGFVFRVHSHTNPGRHAGAPDQFQTLANQDSRGLSNNAHITYLRGCPQSQTWITVQGYPRWLESFSSTSTRATRSVLFANHPGPFSY